jgi:hypothetical protein
MNCGVTAEVIWIVKFCHCYEGYDEAVVLHCRMKIDIYDFSCPTGGCCDDAVIFLFAEVPLAIICLLLTRDTRWWLGAYLCVDHQVLVS